MSFAQSSSLKNHAAPPLAYRSADSVIKLAQKVNMQPSSGKVLHPASLLRTHHSLLGMFTFMWAGNFVLAEIALRELSPISFSVSRFLVAGLVMLSILFVQGKKRAIRQGKTFHLFPSVAGKDWPRLFAVSLLGATIAPWLGIEGLNLTSGGRASLWLALCPVLSAGLGYLMHTETLSKMGFAGLVIAGIGTLGLTADGISPVNSYWLGDILLLIAICCTITELHLIKPLVHKYGATSMVSLRTSIGGTLYVMIAFTSLSQQQWLDLNTWTWVAILVGGGIGVGLGQWVKVRALHMLGPTRVVLYGNLVPPVTLLLAWIVLGTEPTILEMSAGALIILGALCIQVGDPHRPDNVSDHSEAAQAEASINHSTAPVRSS